jgi:hypothetical protein
MAAGTKPTTTVRASSASDRARAMPQVHFLLAACQVTQAERLDHWLPRRSDRAAQDPACGEQVVVGGMQPAPLQVGVSEIDSAP